MECMTNELKDGMANLSGNMHNFGGDVIRQLTLMCEESNR